MTVAEPLEELKGKVVSSKKDLLQQLKKEKARMVKGVFRCFEPPGGSVEFSYREFKGEPVVKYEFRDGEVYTIPRGVAEHIRNNCIRYEHKYVLDEKGNPDIDKMGKPIKRMTFEAIDF